MTHTAPAGGKGPPEGAMELHAEEAALGVVKVGVGPVKRSVALLPAATPTPPAVQLLIDEDLRNDLCDENALAKGERTVARLETGVLFFGMACLMGGHGTSTAFYLHHESKPERTERVTLRHPQRRPSPGEGQSTPRDPHLVGRDGFDPDTGDLVDVSMGGRPGVRPPRPLPLVRD